MPAQLFDSPVYSLEVLPVVSGFEYKVTFSYNLVKHSLE